MTTKPEQINYLTDAFERQMFEQEIRAMAQRAAAEAFGRAMRRLFARVRSVAAKSRQHAASGLRSA